MWKNRVTECLYDKNEEREEKEEECDVSFIL